VTLTPDVDADVAVAFWTARVADALVAVAVCGPQPADVRMHRRTDDT
jgi:hypothetical protein